MNVLKFLIGISAVNEVTSPSQPWSLASGLL